MRCVGPAPAERAPVAGTPPAAEGLGSCAPAVRSSPVALPATTRVRLGGGQRALDDLALVRREGGQHLALLARGHPELVQRARQFGGHLVELL